MRAAAKQHSKRTWANFKHLQWLPTLRAKAQIQFSFIGTRNKPATWYRALWVKYIQLTTELVTVPWPQNRDNKNKNKMLFLEWRLLFWIFCSSTRPFFQASLRNGCLLLKCKTRSSGLEWMWGIHETRHYIPILITKGKQKKLTLGSWGRRFATAEASSGNIRLSLKPKWVALWSRCTEQANLPLHCCVPHWMQRCNSKHIGR